MAEAATPRVPHSMEAPAFGVCVDGHTSTGGASAFLVVTCPSPLFLRWGVLWSAKASTSGLRRTSAASARPARHTSMAAAGATPAEQWPDETSDRPARQPAAVPA